MANKKGKQTELAEDPELPPCAGSELEATVNFEATGIDGIWRPILVTQLDEDFLALTLEDAERLVGFLKKAIVYTKEFRERIIQ